MNQVSHLPYVLFMSTLNAASILFRCISRVKPGFIMDQYSLTLYSEFSLQVLARKCVQLYCCRVCSSGDIESIQKHDVASHHEGHNQPILSASSSSFSTLNLESPLPNHSTSFFRSSALSFLSPSSPAFASFHAP